MWFDQTNEEIVLSRSDLAEIVRRLILYAPPSELLLPSEQEELLKRVEDMKNFLDVMLTRNWVILRLEKIDPVSEKTTGNFVAGV